MPRDSATLDTLDGPAPTGQRHAWLTEDVVTGLARAGDVAVVLAAALAAHLLRFGDLEMPMRYFGAMAVVALLAANVLHGLRVYEFERLTRPVSQVLRLAAGWALVMLLLMALGFMTKTSAEFSRLWVGSWGVLAFMGMVMARLAGAVWIGRLQAAGELTRNVAIYGTGRQAERLVRHLGGRADRAVSLVGVFDERAERAPSQVAGHPVAGGMDELLRLVREGRIHEVVIALPWRAEKRILELLNALRLVPVDVRLAPEDAAYHFLHRGVVHMDGLTMLPIGERPLSSWRWLAKAAEDRALAALILLFAAPTMLAVAAAIKLDSRGPVFFRQRRYGFNDQIIEVFKFRTMHAEDCAPDGAVRQARKDDPRVTRVGALLRRTSLDELPQLLNVLRGEMSLVGPRPHAVAHNDQFIRVVDRYAARHRVKPGITGWAQVNGWRGETDTVRKIEKRVEHDLYYIDNWSVLLDLKILLWTAWVVLRGDNAY